MTIRLLQVWALSALPLLILLPMYVFPLSLGETTIGMYDGRRTLEVLWAAGLLGALLHSGVRDRTIRIWREVPFAVRAGGGGLLLTALVSALVSDAPSYALRGWALLALLLTATLPLAAVLADHRRRTLEVLGLTLVLYGILTFPDPFLHGFVNPRFQGQILAVASPALLFSGSHLLAVMSAPALAVGLVNGSRALVLALVVAFAAAALLWPDRSKRLLSATSGSAVAGLLFAVLALQGHLGAVTDAVGRGAVSRSRLAYWADALGQFASSPVMGVGPEMLARNPGLAGVAAHPHNTLVLIVAETGILGLAFLGIGLYGVLKGIRSRDVASRHWILALVAGGAHSMVSGTVIMPAAQMLLMLAASMVINIPPDSRRLLRGYRVGFTTVLASIGIGALILLAVTWSLPSAPVTGTPWPRFFQHGILP